jgi:hypothetical protein
MVLQHRDKKQKLQTIPCQDETCASNLHGWCQGTPNLIIKERVVEIEPDTLGSHSKALSTTIEVMECANHKIKR